MKTKPHEMKLRIIALLNQSEVEFIEKLAMDSLFSTGSKLTRVEILSALVESAMKLGIRAEGIKTRDELVERILDGLRKREDRRRFPRLAKNLKVAFRKMDSLTDFHTSATTSISMGGLCIDIDSCIPDPALHDVIEITIIDPAVPGEPIKAIGRIVWMKEKDDVHGSEAGIMITYVEEADRDRFMRLSGAMESQRKRGK